MICPAGILLLLAAADRPTNKTAAISAPFVYTTQSCTVPYHFMQNHVCRVHA